MRNSYEDFRAQNSQSHGRGSAQYSPTQVPDSEESIQRSRISIEEIVQQPNRKHCIPLDPELENGTWFNISGEISKCILRMIYTMLQKPYEKYSIMPLDEKDSWHRTFAQEFTWDHRRTPQVLREFDRYAAIQYSRKMATWKQRFENKDLIEEKKKPWDLEEHVWKGFCAYWVLPATKAKSETYLKNRNSQRGGKGRYVHNGGSKSTQKLMLEMTKKAGGIRPDYLTVMETRHTNKRSGEIQDLGIREVIESCKQKKMDRLTQLSELTPDSPSLNELPREEVNGIVLSEIRQVKGRFAGLGGLPMLEAESPSLAFRSSPSEFKAEIERLNNVLMERDAKVEELEKQQEELRTEHSSLKTEHSSTRGELKEMKDFSTDLQQNLLLFLNFFLVVNNKCKIQNNMS